MSHSRRSTSFFFQYSTLSKIDIRNFVTIELNLPVNSETEGPSPPYSLGKISLLTSSYSDSNLFPWNLTCVQKHWIKRHHENRCALSLPFSSFYRSRICWRRRRMPGKLPEFGRSSCSSGEADWHPKMVIQLNTIFIHLMSNTYLPTRCDLYSQCNRHSHEMINWKSIQVENQDDTRREHLLLFVEHDIPHHETYFVYEFRTDFHRVMSGHANDNHLSPKVVMSGQWQISSELQMLK